MNFGIISETVTVLQVNTAESRYLDFDYLE